MKNEYRRGFRLGSLLQILAISTVVLVNINTAYAVDIPPNEYYPFKYNPNDPSTERYNPNPTKSGVIQWSMEQDGKVDFEFDNLLLGELQSAIISFKTGAGTRNYWLTVYPDGKVTLKEVYVWKSPEFTFGNPPDGVNHSGEAGGYFENCSSPCPAHDYPAYGGGTEHSPNVIGLSSTRIYAPYPKFDVNNPDAYLSIAPKQITASFSISKPQVIGNGLLHYYNATADYTLSLSRNYRQWQVNEILAGRLHPTGGDHMKVIVDPLNFGFTSKQAAQVGRWDGTKWISYDHFNWIQHVTGIFDASGNPQSLSGFHYLGPNGLDPLENGVVSGCNKDFWPYFLDEMPISGNSTNNLYSCDYFYVFRQDGRWKDGLGIEDQPNLFNAGWHATFRTELVGVISPQSDQYDPLGQIYATNGMAFNWSWFQLQQTSSELKLKLGFSGIADILLATPPAFGGEGVATIFWQGDNPPPGVNQFPFLRVIDINPGISPNVINLQSIEIPIAIVSTSDHNASEVDPQSVRFGPGKATQSRSPEFRDINGDGKPDLVLYFRTQETGILCEFTGASLTGKTLDGQFIAGTDFFTVEGCSQPVQDTDNDGVSDASDQCPASNLSKTVFVDRCDSGVQNKMLQNGCNIADEVDKCSRGVQNHGEFVSCISELTNNLKKAGVITGNNKGKIESCAAHASIP